MKVHPRTNTGEAYGPGSEGVVRDNSLDEMSDKEFHVQTCLITLEVPVMADSTRLSAR